MKIHFLTFSPFHDYFEMKLRLDAPIILKKS